MNKRDINATYRIQFHKDFNFNDFEKVIPYLVQLGVKTIYASPIFKAVPGSIHGYDVLDAHEINPEIGSLDQLYKISKKLKAAGIQWLQDVVPNHMAFHPDNPWLADVLEKGMASHYANFFDIDWEHPVFHGRLMLPVLGKPLEDSINDGDLSLVYDDYKLHLKHYDMMLPVQHDTYSILFEGEENSGIGKRLAHIKQEADTTTLSIVLAMLADDKEIQDYVAHQLEKINADKVLLKRIVDQQHYALCLWQETDRQINFRRFFTINGLLCLNMQSYQVFCKYHSLIFKLCKEGVFQGLRIDHIDGLADPTEYLFRLREAVGNDVYIVVEKILGEKEELPVYWPIEGTTGYDFLAIANNVFTDHAGAERLRRYYNRKITDEASYRQALQEKKAMILYNHMAGELDNLCRLFMSLDLLTPEQTESINPGLLEKAIAELLINCPVYKFYGNHFPLGETEAVAIENTLQQANAEQSDLGRHLAILKDVLLNLPQQKDEDYNARVLKFYQRCMQFTGVLMAKGGEDTAMYTYNRFIAHNDVGDTPRATGYSADDYHTQMIRRQESWPYALNGTATHDTKRGEDARARLNILSDLPDEWLAAVKEWTNINNDLRQNNAPDENDEYFIYQALLGSYPMPGQLIEDFNERFKAYIEKALREAKTHTDWAKPDEAYEQSVQSFLDTILTPQSEFLKSFQAFLNSIADAGIVNSISQLCLKFTSPGVPDIYQGCELWDFSMVDPDNRRPVDYVQRGSWLAEMNIHCTPQELWQSRYEGKIKLWFTKQLLQETANMPDVLKEGRYVPLKVMGKYSSNILAYAREYKHVWYVVILPLQSAQIAKQQKKDVMSIDWEDTRVLLSDDVPMTFTDVISGVQGQKEPELLVAPFLQKFPVALIKYEAVPNKRSAGLLLPLFSLPSDYGIGDFGSSTKEFIDFLYAAGQRYWQLLPLNPISSGTGYSPYSSISSMALNSLFIDLNGLADMGLLEKAELSQCLIPRADKVDYAEVEELKDRLCSKAFEHFYNGNFIDDQQLFRRFCIEEAYWLNDYALYVALRRHFDYKPWYEWDAVFKDRDKEALEKFAVENKERIRKTKWLQYIATRQWKAIRKYANSRGIQLFGDVPFYMSHDSADVWANRDIFCLDKEGDMTGVAGVPPDYFSRTGQLWGMPTYNWKILKERNYDWWLDRIRQNAQLFDVVRLDHFRAFEAYWEVPAGNETAEHGKWIKGPGTHFFKTVREQLGDLPFIAEDLGDNMADVYRLRDKVALPGMKVLQFAWGDNMPVAVDIPHNFPLNCVVYTGTHDNNTTKGWFLNETKEADRKRLEQYTNTKVNEDNVDDVLSRMAYATVASIAILPMQDVLCLGPESRINTPGTATNNWAWRISENELNEQIKEKLLGWVKFYNRL